MKRMRASLQLALLLLLFSPGLFSQSRDTIKLDFGSDLSPSPWNNMNSPSSGVIDDLQNSKGNLTGVSVMVVDSFNAINTNGTKAPDPSLGLPASATGDSFFGNVGAFGGQVQPSGALLFGKLDTSKMYEFRIFASRDASDNRQAMYELAGETVDTVYLDAASNVDKVAITSLRPDANGDIKLTASPGPENTNATKFYYLGLVEVSYEGPPAPVGVDTVLVDFGDNLSPLPWNNIADPVGGTIEGLMNAKGNPTPYAITINDAFNNINRAGAMNPDSALGMPPTATGDSFFGNFTDFGGQVQPTGAFVISNLDPSLTYSFEIFGSRDAIDNRETKYEISGAGRDSAFLNTSSNVDKLALLSMQPDTAGKIEILVTAGPNNDNPTKFFYIGAFRMMYDEQPEPPAVSNVDSILVDFGDNLSGLPWIDVIDPVAGVVTNMTTKTGKETGYVLSVTDAFNNINRAGTANPAKATGFPGTVGGDSFFGNVTDFGGQIQPTGAITLSQLNPYNDYEFTFFASRDGVTDNREAMYILQGETTDTTYLDASGNTDKVAIIHMKSDANGDIVITAAPGPNNNNSTGFYYLGGMIVSYEDQPIPSPFDTISIDFGTTLSPGPWMNLENARQGEIADLITSRNINSGYGVRITDPFNGVNTNGTINPKAELGLPPSASGDSFFGNILDFSGAIEPTGEIELYNLDTEKEYTLIIFASRSASDNRETQYNIVGADSVSLFLNVSSNSDKVVTATMKPGADGIISLLAKPGPNNNNPSGFYYLGSLQVAFEGVSKGEEALDLVQPNGGEIWQQGREAVIQWTSRNIAEVNLEYSTDNGGNWKEIGSAAGSARQYNWLVPNEPTTQALVRIRGGALSDQSEGTFSIVENDGICRIVVLGSSTAEGAGASPRDSAWVNRYAAALSSNNAFEVINLGRGGYNTYNILPTGTVSPGIGVAIDVERNVTKALSLDPSYIIVNMPSNDAASNYGLTQQMRNFELVAQTAAAAGVEVYICTTQPRNFTNTALTQIQIDVRDSIYRRFGDHAIDFWTGVADSTGRIEPSLDSGDGVHLNNAGHRLLFERVWALGLQNRSCGTVGLVEEDWDVSPHTILYPNPNNGEFTLKNQSGYAITSVKIYDTAGRVVYDKRGKWESDFTVQTNDKQLQAGLYFCQISYEVKDNLVQKVLPVLIEK